MKTTLLQYGAALTVGLLLFAAAARVDTEPEVLRPPRAIVPDQLFGMHIHHAAEDTPWPSVPFSAWRLWDSGVGWNQLEPEKGKWNWSKLDRYVELAQLHNKEIVLPLGLTPRWASARPEESSIYNEKGIAAEPTNLFDWRNYVRQVATRYKGRITTYEIWNEPNDPKFFSGSAEAMLRLSKEAYFTLKSIDPNVRVVSPAATGKNGPAWLDRYLSLGGGEYADVMAYHFYVIPHDPEAMLPVIANVKEVLRRHGINKPLWNTETGWSAPKDMSAEMAASFVARSYILNWAAGVERLYWYAWDNYKWVSLRMTKDDLATPTEAAHAYATVRDWMTGSRLDNCSRSRHVWTCTLQREDGTSAWLLWSTSGETSFSIPADWSAVDMQTLNQRRQPLRADASVRLTGAPLMVSAAKRK